MQYAVLDKDLQFAGLLSEKKRKLLGAPTQAGLIIFLWYIAHMFTLSVPALRKCVQKFL